MITRLYEFFMDIWVGIIKFVIVVIGCVIFLSIFGALFASIINMFK
jgi:hypothetical protein